MDNVFAYLGTLGGFNTLTNKNGELNKIWEGMDTKELPFHIKENVAAEEVAATVINLFSKNYNYILNSPTQTVTLNSEAIEKFKSFYQGLVKKYFNKEITNGIFDNIFPQDSLTINENLAWELHSKIIKTLIDPCFDKEDYNSFLEKLGNIFPNIPKNEDEIRVFNCRKYLNKKKEEFGNYVISSLKNELIFIMISSWEYTQSLYQLKIRNVNGDKKPDYISAFDWNQRNVQRIIQHSDQKLDELNPNGFNLILEDKNDSSVKITINPLEKINKSVALPALPHFIKRLYDGKKPERDILMHSIYDIGPVLGLIGSATPKKNPYLILNSEIDKASNSSISESTNKLKTNKSNNTTASIYSFLSSFSCVPLKSSDGGFSADKVIAKCISEIEKEPSNPRKLISSDFLETVTPAKLTVFGQFLIERFVNGCLLSKVYLCKNESPAQKYINKYTKKPCEDEFEDYFDFYINKIVNKLMLLPLVRTRLYVMDYLQSYIKNISELNPKPQPFGEPERTPALIYHYLEELTSYIRDNIKYWTEVVLPWHILCFHHLVTSLDLNIDSNEYFESIYNNYQFYDYNEQGKIDINQCSDIFNNMHLKQIRTLDKESKNAFNISSKKFYQYFMHDTLRSIFVYNFSIQLDNYFPDKNLSSFKNTEELKQALLFDGSITIGGLRITTPDD